MQEITKRDLDLAWLAGIWEGEGTAGLRWAKKRHQGSTRRCYLYMSISQKETSMLIEVNRIAGAGRIHSANRKDGKALFAWQAACAAARKIMTELLPYVRSNHKRKQMENAIALDVEMRKLGTEARRASLTKAREIRWRTYRAKISGKETETRISE